MAKKPEVIEDISRCRQVVDILSREEVLAVDCEGVSLGRDGPLTLVQVGTYSGDVYLFDIQRNKDLLKGGKLGQLLESIAIVKVIVLLICVMYQNNRMSAEIHHKQFKDLTLYLRLFTENYINEKYY